MNRTDLLKASAGMLFALLLGGCDRGLPKGKHTIAAFSFITSSTTIQEVTNRLGAPDAITGSGILRYQYHLTDCSYVRIWPAKWSQPTSTVVLMVHGTNTLINVR